MGRGQNLGSITYVLLRGESGCFAAGVAFARGGRWTVPGIWVITGG